jgi:iron complex transport system substrate-binding protein
MFHLILRFGWLSTLVLLFHACRTNENQYTVQRKAGNLIRYANCIEMYPDKSAGFRVVIKHPETSKQIILNIKRGEIQLDDRSFKLNHTQQIKLAALSATQVGMLVKLNKRNSLKAISSSQYLFDTVIRKRVQIGLIEEIGAEEAPNFEALVKAFPHLVLFSGFGKDFPMKDKLSSMGIFTLPVYDWKEEHPLGKAEWIKLIGCLTGTFDKACTYFDRVEKAYLSAVKRAKSVDSKRTVMSGNLIGDNWFTPSGASYQARLFKDAGFFYPFSGTIGQGSIAKSMEQMIATCQFADVWINPGEMSLRKLLHQNPRLTHFDAVKKRAVYCYSHNLNYFWEYAALEPDKVLNDLIQIRQGVQTNLYFYKLLP